MIIVPGLGGSQMEARLVNKRSSPGLLCKGGSADWFALWLNLEPFVTRTLQAFRSFHSFIPFVHSSDPSIHHRPE